MRAASNRSPASHHKHIEMAMKYAEFHPSQDDVAPHFEHKGEILRRSGCV